VGAASVSVPVTFEPNVGQASATIQFIGRGKGLTLFLTKSAIQIAIPSRSPESGSNGILSMRLNGTGFSWTGKGTLRGQTNYFIGNDPRKWRTNVPHFSRVEAHVAKSIDVVVYGNDEGAEYDLRVAPGADASKFRFAIAGVRDMRLTSIGDLLMRVGEREVRMKKPEIYEEPGSSEGARKKDLMAYRRSMMQRGVDGGYRIEADGSVGFWIGRHDAGSTLILDPSLSVAYSTFLGGAGADAANSIALDSSGNVYVSGTTASAATFTEGPGSILGPGVASGSSTSQFFIAKIDPAVSGAGSLVYLTFLGGSASQSGGSLAIDASGDVALSGTTTSADFPVTDGSQLTLGANDISVSEISPTGSVLVFSTLFGGSGVESQYGTGGIALDTSGNIWIASDTSSSDLPATTGAYQTMLGGTTADAFLTIFNPSATPSLTYCSYLGTNANAKVGVGGIAVDATGNGYVAGFVSDAGNIFPAKNAFQSTYGGDPSDAFLMKIMPAGQGTADLVYATLLGGGAADQALAVTVDSGTPANAYVTGTTQSKNFPTTGVVAPYQANLHANATANAFLTVIGQNGTTGNAFIDYSTYLGGSESDAGQGVAIGALNEIYVTGTATSWDFPWKDNFQPFNGSADVFIAKLNLAMPGSASLIYATPLGGTAPPGTSVTAGGNGIATDGSGRVYVAGAATAADFPTVVSTSGIMNGFQPICSSCQGTSPQSDSFVLEIQENPALEPSVYFSLPRIAYPPMALGTQEAPQLIAVHNGGEASLTVLSLAITGADSSDFSLIGQGACEGQTISPGSQCGMEVGFIPSIVGNETAVLSITDDAPGSPQVLELVGVGQGPLAQVSPLSINFGNVPAGSIPTTGQTINITNVGNQTLSISSIAESGPNTAQFPVNGKTFTCGQTLAAGQSCSAQAFFQPQTTGTFHAEMDILDNSGGVSNAKQVVTLAGVGIPPAPVAVVVPVTLAFGSVALGATTGTQIVTLTNQGSAALNLTSIGLIGSNSADFAIVAVGNNSCPAQFGAVIAGGSCTVAVQFSPQSAGLKNASLSFADNGAGSPQAVSLSGTAIAPPTIQVLPSGLNFASQSVGIASAAQSVSVANTGMSSLSINSISASGANAADFVQTNNCPPALGRGAACVINIAFKPNVGSSAARTASLDVADNAPGSPQIIPLSGLATQASLSLSPASISFGSQVAGASGSSVTVTASDNGTGALAFSAIRVTGTNPGDFVIGSDTCASANTPAGSACTIQLTFSPACVNAPAARGATLVLTDNSPGSPQSVSLSGTAAGDFCFDPPSGATTATVTAGQTATYSLVIYSPNGYTGSVSLACAGAPPEGVCTPSLASVTLPAQFAVTVTTVANSFFSPAQRRELTPGYPMRTLRLLSISLMVVAMLISRLVVCLPKQQHSRLALLNCAPFILIFAVALALAACGGGGTGTSADPGTPDQTYPLTLTGTAADGTTRSLNLTLNVRN